MSDRIPQDSTIATIWPMLSNKRDFIAGARHKALLCQKEHGNAYVKIGVTGSGQKPCYRIFYKGSNGMTEEIFGSYWDNHQPLDNERAINSNWSTEAMSFAELDAFMLEKHPPKKI